MGLLPVLQLQAVLDAPQKFIGVVEFVEVLAANVVLVMQLLQRK